jgi:hypothetical protein
LWIIRHRARWHEPSLVWRSPGVQDPGSGGVAVIIALNRLILVQQLAAG